MRTSPGEAGDAGVVRKAGEEGTTTSKRTRKAPKIKGMKGGRRKKEKTRFARLDGELEASDDDEQEFGEGDESLSEVDADVEIEMVDQVELEAEGVEQFEVAPPDTAPNAVAAELPLELQLQIPSEGRLSREEEEAMRNVLVL